MNSRLLWWEGKNNTFKEAAAMSTENQRLIFISYSRADRDFALQLATELRSSGFRIWLDQLDIPTGARWDDEVEKALVNCGIFMIILTPHSIASNNVKDEIGYAIDNNKRILPVLLQNAEVPLRLRRFQYVDFTAKTYKEGIESAKQLLRNLGSEPVTAPQQPVRVYNPPIQPPQVQPGNPGHTVVYPPLVTGPNYANEARIALILGAASIVAGLCFGLLGLFPAAITMFFGFRGLKSSRQLEAIGGLALSVVSILIAIVMALLSLSAYSYY